MLEEISKQHDLKVLAVSVGEPQDLTDEKGHVVQSAINKTVTKVPLFLTHTNFNGDRQADQKNHGGEDKAVLGYSYDHYPYWVEKLGVQIDFGAFGENLTISGLTEDTVHIGDMFGLDEAIIQVTQPRQPCFKLAFKHRVKEMPLWVEETGRSGIYFRVLKEGWVSPQPKLTRIEKGEGTLTLGQINHILFSQNPKEADLRSVIEQIGIAESLKSSLIKKLNRLEKMR